MPSPDSAAARRSVGTFAKAAGHTRSLSSLPVIRPLISLWLACTFAASAFAVTPTDPSAATSPTTAMTSAEFGRDVKLAPIVVKGERLSISIHARTDADRRYATAFAEGVVKVAYETMEKSTGAGLVIVGRDGEPHPVTIIRRFHALAEAGQLAPDVAAQVRTLDAQIAAWKTTLNLDHPHDGEGEHGPNITFDMLVPALPVPLEGVGSRLYQIAWAEGFDDARLDAKLRSLTAADFASDALTSYDWVFYLPPRGAFNGVMDQLMKEVMAHQKMGLFKRAAIRSAMVVFRPAIKKAVEGFRKGMLFMTILRARSDWNKEDIKALTGAYVQVLMPDFKFNDSTERTHERIMQAIEQQKVRNAEYAKDPFVSPPRLPSPDLAAYARFAGDYGKVTIGKKNVRGKPSRTFLRRDDTWLWQYHDGKSTLLHPAGDRLLVSADGKLTVEFKLDDQGTVTAAEERRHRYRETFPHPVVEVKK